MRLPVREEYEFWLTTLRKLTEDRSDDYYWDGECFDREWIDPYLALMEQLRANCLDFNITSYTKMCFGAVLQIRKAKWQETFEKYKRHLDGYEYRLDHHLSRHLPEPAPAPAPAVLH